MSDNSNLEFPSDLFYHPENHMWAKNNGESELVTVGIDALALDSLGEIAYVSFAEVGTGVRKGDPIGTLESAKMTTEIFSPLSGKISTLNETVLANPRLINEQPYGDGWLIKMISPEWDMDSAGLISGEAIPGWLKKEIERYEEENLLD